MRWLESGVKVGGRGRTPGPPGGAAFQYKNLDNNFSRHFFFRVSGFFLYFFSDPLGSPLLKKIIFFEIPTTL
jgi:hypothetical protein